VFVRDASCVPGAVNFNRQERRERKGNVFGLVILKILRAHCVLCGSMLAFAPITVSCLEKSQNLELRVRFRYTMSDA
jgi:hypothetical protein